MNKLKDFSLYMYEYNIFSSGHFWHFSEYHFGVSKKIEQLAGGVTVTSFNEKRVLFCVCVCVAFGSKCYSKEHRRFWKKLF